MKTNYNYELIKDYLDGILDSKTSEEIKNLIKSDDAAKGIAKGILVLKGHFENDDAIDKYLSRLLTPKQKLIADTKRSNNKINTLKIAASVILVAVSGLLMYQSTKPTLAELVEAEFSNPYQASTILRDSKALNDFDKAMVTYNEGEYLKTYELLKDESGTQAVFFKGLSLLYAGEYSLAIQQLEKIELAKSRFEEQGRWYLVLTYLKANEKEKAKETLGIITSNNNHFKQKEALKIMDFLID